MDEFKEISVIERIYFCNKICKQIQSDSRVKSIVNCIYLTREKKVSYGEEKLKRDRLLDLNELIFINNVY